MPQRDARRPQPTGIDPARLGERDDPQNAILGEDWGEPEEGAVHGANHTRRGEPSDDRMQGIKTRTAAKDQISRRG